MIDVLLAAVLLAHSWYPKACCGGNDCHPVPCGELQLKDGVIWNRIYFGPAMIHPSLDSYCHVCVSAPNSGEIPRIPNCVFIPKVPHEQQRDCVSRAGGRFPERSAFHRLRRKNSPGIMFRTNI